MTAAALALLWLGMWVSLGLGYWITLLLAVPAAGFMVRLFVIQQVTGGLFRRGARHSAPRVAISDEEARAHYLPRLAPLPRRIPASMLDEARMESLPILRHHQIEAFENA